MAELQPILVTNLVGINLPGQWKILRMCWSIKLLEVRLEHRHHFSNCLAVKSKLTFSDSDCSQIRLMNLVAEFKTFRQKLFRLDVFCCVINRHWLQYSE